MADPGGILDAIDSALRDYSVSGDAMRSAPLPLPEMTPRRMDTARRLCAATGLDGYAALCVAAESEHRVTGGPFADLMGALRPPLSLVLGEPFLIGVSIDTTRFMAGIRQMTEAMTQAFRPIAEYASALGKALGPWAHQVDAIQNPSWHKRRCRACNPAAFCDPVPGGAEYHRRQKARKRRARRG